MLPSSQIFYYFGVGRSEFFIFFFLFFLPIRYLWGAEFGTSTNDLQASFIIKRVVESQCHLLSFEDQGFKPNSYLKTVIIGIIGIIVIIFLIKNKQTKKPNKNDPILTHFMVGRLYFFSLITLPWVYCAKEYFSFSKFSHFKDYFTNYETNTRHHQLSYVF